MSAPWSADFSYACYRRLLDALSTAFTVHRVEEAPELLARTGGRPACLLRHDVDVALAPAVRMGEIEAEQGIASTYYLLVRSPLYSIEAEAPAIGRLRALGHEVGLHYDFHGPLDRGAAPTLEAAEAQAAEDCARLEAVLGEPVRSLSFHRPLAHFLHGPLRVAGRVNAYARELMGWYLSDSAGRWREGEPLAALAAPRAPLLQLLTHPVWWAERHRPAPEALEEFYRGAARGLAPERARALDLALAGQLGVRRSGYDPAIQPTEDAR